MFRLSNKLVRRGIESMPQSKLNVDGNNNNLKLNTGKYRNVKKRDHVDDAFAIGLSAVENSVVCPGSDRRN